MNLFKSLKIKQSGFSLVEVMIGGSMLVGVSMAGYSMYITRTKSQDQIERLREVETYHKALIHSLQISSNCNATLKPWARARTVPNADIQSISFCSTNCTDDKTASEVTATSVPKITESSAAPTDGTQWIDNKRRWEVTDISAPNPVSRSGILNLNITYTLDPQGARPKIVVRPIPLPVKFAQTAPPVFVSCISDKESNVRSLHYDMCETIGGSSTSGQMLRWNDLTQKCDVIRNPIGCWTTGEKVDGISDTGSLTCISMTLDVDTTPLYDATDADCTAARMPSVLVTADGKVQALCN